LAHRADRDYFEFNLSHPKAQQKVGTITIELDKTDTKRNVFDVSLYFDDKPHVYRDKPINEAVYFYVQGASSAEELVVNKLSKDSIAGYISTPKGFFSSTPNVPAIGPGQGEGGGTGGEIFSVGGDVSAPIPIYKPEPAYSEEARKAKYEGTVLLRIVVDAQGNVNRDVRVVKPLGLGLDEKAVQAVQTWKFKPAMRNGVPVPVRVGVEVIFRLKVLLPGAVRENPKDGLNYVWIPPGSFKMGCSPGDNECLDHEKPSHQVTIGKGFWIGQTEATVGAYKRFAAATGRQMPPAPSDRNGWAKDDMPIVNVTWNEAHDFCAWAGGRLATEAEWEYAARGGSTAARYGPIDEIAWYDKNSGGQTAAVAQKGANGFGLFDTLGNAYEWVNDWYDEHYYSSSPGTDPRGPASGQYRVLRGGSSHCDPINVRVSNRYGVNPAYRYADDGVRCGWEVGNP
jgi:TonB family protein